MGCVPEQNNPKVYTSLHIGIPNLCSTSHWNAVLQIILHNERLAQIIVQHHSACSQSECLICVILSCMNGLFDGDIFTLNILSDISERYYTITDPFDLFSLILGKLHHSFMSTLNFPDSNIGTPVSDLFAGSFTRKGRCLLCQRGSTDVITFFSFQIEVTANITVQDAVSQYLSSKVKGIANCDFCQMLNVYEQECIDITLPRLFCIRFLRPTTDSSILRKSVTVNPEMVLMGNTLQAKYEFSCSILADKNHFTYITRCDKTGALIVINDTTITKMTYGKLSSSHIGHRVHTLIYEQVQDVAQNLAEVPSTPKATRTGNRRVTSTSKNWEVTVLSAHESVLNPEEISSQAGTSIADNAALSDVSHGFQWDTQKRKRKLTSHQDFEDTSIGLDMPSPLKNHKDESEFVIKKRKRRTPQVVTSPLLQHGSEPMIKTGVKTRKKNKNQWRSVSYLNGIKTIHIRVMISYELWKQNMDDGDFKFFTGLSKFNFEAVYVLLEAEEGIMKLKLSHKKATPKRKTRPTIISSQSRLLLCLVRLRRGTPLRDLAYQFGIGKTYAGNIFFGVIRKLYNTFKSMEEAMFSPPEEQQNNRPEAFKPFPDVKVIIDGAEFRIQSASNYQQQGNTWSKYKHSNTAKYLIGISVFGAVTFVSEGFEGNMSDNEIMKASGIKKYLKKGDAVMCDRGFNIAGELLEAGVKTIKPPSFRNRRHFTPPEQLYNSAVTQARIYVEHAIGKIKEFRLVRYTIPLSLRATLNDLVYVAAYLTNFADRAIRKKKSNINRQR